MSSNSALGAHSPKRDRDEIVSAIDIVDRLWEINEIGFGAPKVLCTVGLVVNFPFLLPTAVMQDGGVRAVSPSGCIGSAGRLCVHVTCRAGR